MIGPRWIGLGRLLAELSEVANGEHVRRVCTICARGGSKGVKNKNVRPLAGKPLIAHSILQARESRLFDLVAVSSDSEEILEIASRFGADHVVRRPDEMATDQAAKGPAIAHCAREVERLTGVQFETFVDLAATSPLRNVADIAGAVALLEEKNISNVLTGTPSRNSPYLSLVELDRAGVVHVSKPTDWPIVRRQDAPACYDLNGSVYVWRRDAIFDREMFFRSDTQLFVMPEERSIDIDTELDFKIVEFLMHG